MKHTALTLGVLLLIPLAALPTAALKPRATALPIAAGQSAGDAAVEFETPAMPANPQLPETIEDKTLVAWVSPANLEQQGAESSR